MPDTVAPLAGVLKASVSGAGAATGYMERRPARSSALSAAPRPSKCAVAYMVAVASVEWPRPSTWPSSWVATSAKLAKVS